MSHIETETRTCTCGAEWEALRNWPADAVCTPCAQRDHQEFINGLNEGKAYRIDSIGGMCPAQAEGEWIDGQQFYFRARHGEWTLRVDPDDAVGGRVIAGGDDPTNGFMEPKEVAALLDNEATR